MKAKVLFWLYCCSRIQVADEENSWVEYSTIRADIKFQILFLFSYSDMWKRPSQQLLVLSEKKKQNNVWNLYKVNNSDTRTTLLMSASRTDVFICDFEQVSAGWRKEKYVIKKLVELILRIKSMIREILFQISLQLQTLVANLFPVMV